MKNVWKRILCLVLAVAILALLPTRTAKAEGGTVEEFVTRLYTLCLNREPDAKGMNEWCTWLSDGSSTGTRAAHGFVFSDEFIANGYSDDEFIQMLYRIFLDREYDAEGMGTWLGLMQNGGYGREAVFNGFVASDEFARICEAYGISSNGRIPEAELQIGSYVSFGSYEQDNNMENGREKIDWLVIDKADGKVLLVSKYALDAKVYNDELVDVTWEECTLRNWLNNEFYIEAFSETEKAAIVMTNVQNEDNEEYGVDGGNDTEDNIFLLSIKECYFYLDEEQKLAELTEYAKAQGGYYDDRFGGASWWLRSPGVVGLCASAAVEYVGEVGKFIRIHEDYGVNYENPCVRPALWKELQ